MNRWRYINSSTQTTSPLFHTANPADQPPRIPRQLAAIELVVGAYPHRRDWCGEVVAHQYKKATGTRPHPARWARETALIPDQHRRSQFARLGARFVGELPTRARLERGESQSAASWCFGFVRHPEKPPHSRRPVRGKWPVLIARSLGASAMDQRTVLIPDHPRPPGAGTHTQERRHA